MNPLSAADAESVGTGAEVKAPDLKPSEETKYAISSESEALSVCRSLRQSWEKGIKNRAIGTAYLNGAKPKIVAQLRQLARDWVPNVSSGVLRNECAPIPARFFMPILTASSLTAAALPAGWPLGAEKSRFFQEEVTKTIRSWRKWPWFVKQLDREVGFFGFGFAVFADEYDWRPLFIRQDRGFVPVGTEVMDDFPAFFMFQYDYRVDELLRIVEETRDAGDHWNLDNVAAAVNAATPKTRDPSSLNAAKYEEMVRQATIGQSYEKGCRLIPTWQLLSVNPDGSVSKHIVLADEGLVDTTNTTSTKSENRMLYDKASQFDSMEDAQHTIVFDPDDGTIHGSWGAVQMCFDLALECEKSICDWIMSLKQAAKTKIQVAEGKSLEEVKTKVDDVNMLVSGGTFAGNIAATSTDPRPFQALIDGLMTSIRQKIGNYIPPIPLTRTDVKAAQIDEKVKEQQERQEQALLIHLLQFSRLIQTMTRRLVNSDSQDDDAKDLQETLKQKLAREEINKLAEQVPANTIFDFTEYAASKRAAFAATKMDNPFYNHRALEEVQTFAIGGRAFSESVLLPGEDATVEAGAKRQQEIETAVMKSGTVIEVLPMDPDWYHMQALRPELERILMTNPRDPVAGTLLNHFLAHAVGAMAKKALPKDQYNPTKAFISKAAKAIQTGELPPDGFADNLDPIAAMQAKVAQKSPLTGSPSAEPQLSAVGADEAGNEALVSGSASP